MSNVGLLYVGAILIVNGIMLLGVISARATVPLNLFVGTMQVVIPTVMMVTAHGEGAVIADAGGLYLFGFTYLWVGINGATGWPAEGLGWFSLFVAFVGAAIDYKAEERLPLDNLEQRPNGVEHGLVQESVSRG